MSSQPIKDLVTTLRDMRTPLAVAAADRIEYLEARVAILDRCNAKIDCISRREAMQQKDGS